MKQIVKDIESNQQLILSNLFKSLYYLNEISEIKLSNEECQVITTLLDEQFLKIKRESITETEIKSFSYFLNALTTIQYKNKIFFEKIISFFARANSEFWFEPGIVWLPSIFEYLCTNADDAVEFFIKEENLSRSSIFIFSKMCIENCLPLRQVLIKNPQNLIRMVNGEFINQLGNWEHSRFMNAEIAEYRVLSILNILAKHHEEWISTQNELVDSLRSLWNSKEFRFRYDIRRMPDAQSGEITVENMKSTKFEVPKLCVRIIQVKN